MERAAKSAGLSTRHAWRLLSNPEFKGQLDEARERIFNETLGRLQAGISDATDILLEVLHDKDNPPTVRVSAGRCLLEAALQTWEIRSLERRLAALEKRINGKPT